MLAVPRSRPPSVCWRWDPGSVWRAPLLPLTLAATAGIVIDRYADLPLTASLITAAACLLAWAVVSLGRQPGLALIYLWGSVGALAAAYHHWYLEIDADDVAHHATEEIQPVLLRGTCATEPVIPALPMHDALHSFPPAATTRLVVRATHLKPRDRWLPVSGLVQVMIAGKLHGRHVGDEIELDGLLLRPQPPANPGGFDYVAFLKDQQIHTVLEVRNPAADIKLLAEGSAWSIARSLALVRTWAVASLRETVQGKEGNLAAALLLGENAALPAADWEAYQRTGVIHVLAISGQHLVVLGGLLWLTLRPWRLPRRYGAILVGVFVLAYAMLAGGRPPVMRAAVVACALCGSLLIRRPMLPANSFALAWLVVAVLNPTDVFNAGCQLSFVAVAVLRWGTTFWNREDPDPLDRLIEESQPTWRRSVGTLGRMIAAAYAINAAIWVAVAPLAAFHFHTVQPIGLLIGPPVVLLTSIALVGGFLFLLLAPLAPLAYPFALLTRWGLGGADLLVSDAVTWPGAYWYVADVPVWWTGLFYPALLASLTLAPLRQRWRWTALAGALWLMVGLLIDLVRPGSGELRCTFLAVGHGGCTILETPDGRTLLYDAGAIGGPDLTRRHIAPYLWTRGIRRIDEVFLSHADLDHFNGVSALLERFAIGQVSCTPTFRDRKLKAVEVTLRAIERRGVPVRVLRAGDRLTAGAVRLDVLHPPAQGPEGIENVRSLVLLVRHNEHTILLTGDLEGVGLDMLLARPALKVDVLMAPHHGSPKANPVALAKWARPTFVVSCQGRPRGSGNAEDAYKEVRSRFLRTWLDGAIAVRSGGNGLVVEVFRNGRWSPVSHKADR
ncbi:MAG TPA: ComEC/Rec2 family competence protein [Gemmataceae bacterium]|nr:ComEC/Rec2 family competence protein [Gemmataceae bacterium]